MPQFTYVPHPAGTTREEFALLLNLRRESLDAATAQASLGSALPVSWRRGWTAHLNILGRDLDGSLCASVTVRGPALAIPYVRKVRLCSRERLPWGLSKE